MVEPSAAHWRSVPRDVLTWREWEGELVVRHAGTGDTHLLSPVGKRILLALVRADCALPIPALVQELPSDEADELDRVTSVEAILAEFQHLGLATPDSA